MIKIAEQEEKPRTVFEVKMKCPHCDKRIIATKTKKRISEAVAAEYEEKLKIIKDDQTTLKEVKKSKKPIKVIKKK